MDETLVLFDLDLRVLARNAAAQHPRQVAAAEVLRRLHERAMAGRGPVAQDYLHASPDHVMTGMTGAQLAAELHESRPGLPIVMITG